ncbi:flagellar protein FlaG [Tumebacillus lipolyticus]|uniref:Flagellar protein FlaG n=1 Tax=Tumebacillus lipolyticus TaxID=1280370 RepID=A0ABW4ZXE6_9BACL
MQIRNDVSIDQLLREPLTRNHEKASAPLTSTEAVAQEDPAFDESKTDEHVKRVNRALEQNQSNLTFRIRAEGGRQIVQLVEKEGEKVILQLPPEGLLELEKRLKEATGTVVDKRL